MQLTESIDYFDPTISCDGVPTIDFHHRDVEDHICPGCNRANPRLEPQALVPIVAHNDVRRYKHIKFVEDVLID